LFTLFLGELAPTIGLEKGRLNLDSFPQEDVNSYSGADDDGFPSV
jgi:hypothetical protein